MRAFLRKMRRFAVQSANAGQKKFATHFPFIDSASQKRREMAMPALLATAL